MTKRICTRFYDVASLPSIMVLLFLTMGVVMASSSSLSSSSSSSSSSTVSEQRRIAWIPQYTSSLDRSRRCHTSRDGFVTNKYNNHNYDNNHKIGPIFLSADGNKDQDLQHELEYDSRSTNDPDLSTEFYQGSEERKLRLHRALEVIGIHTEDFIHRPEFMGSAAYRTYTSFIVPKSKGAWIMAEQPQRATTVANSISFLLREHRSHQEDWLRNHDRSLEEVKDILNDKIRHPIILILDDVRSAHNVGTIIRFAEAAFVEKILLCGSMTPSPPNPKVLKTALGAAEYVPYEVHGSTLHTIQQLKARNVKVYAVETTSRSIPFWNVSLFEPITPTNDGSPTETTETTQQPQQPQKVAFVFGNELVGVDVQVLEECCGILSVPTHGIKNSLNIATCASIVTWEALRQWELRHTLHPSGGQ